MTKYLDLVQECDNFPHYDLSQPEIYTEALKSLWYFYLPDDPEPHGFLTDSVVERMPWTAHFRISSSPRKQVHLLKPETEQWQTSCGEAIQELIDLAREQGVFPRLGKKNTEQFPIVGARFDIGIERSAFSLFGIIGRGAHMTVYTRTHEGLKFWIARRSATKSTYPSMLDQAVAGGVARGEGPLDCLVREAGEEAGLSPERVRNDVVATGTVSWFNVSDERAGGEVGLMNPGVLYTYDLEVSSTEVEFQAVEGDISKFSLLGLSEVLTALRQGEFKPSCAMVMLDFLIRHGLITAENEPDYGEIISRLHRKLPFRMNPA
ncbi:hypothetical protein N0V93_008484 [Gnomoniopsis smithogilvyi]|uniref:Nudix hydrolase domain-containing protein n=1 Tax=Gnomoniopsis smithogilvyi TaxID=1191159 RepID=A0A9W8YMT8_9PEZI|nr:hypothetical protein N0V93_008484 [Gnomoniopsis smithogilvyi]